MSVVASAMANGTLRNSARLFASSVFPEPEGPISRTLDFSMATCSEGGLGDDRSGGVPIEGVQESHEVVADGDGQGPLGPVLANDELVQVGHDLPGRGDGVRATLGGTEISVMTKTPVGLRTLPPPSGGIRRIPRCQSTVLGADQGLKFLTSQRSRPRPVESRCELKNSSLVASTGRGYHPENSSTPGNTKNAGLEKG